MTNEEIFSFIDHTLLAATADRPAVRTLCEEALRYGMASVCVPPIYVPEIRSWYPEGLRICTVVGFPLGFQAVPVKVFETGEAIGEGADEIDMVVGLTRVKNGSFDEVRREIEAVRAAAGGRILKVIVETSVLTEEEKIRLCYCVSDAGADYIKTSTGFSDGGAVLSDVRLFREHLDPGVKIKAAGGIRTRRQLEDFLAAGCVRIGTSRALSILLGEKGDPPACTY